MHEAFGLFCDAIEELTGEERNDVPMWCCTALGHFGDMSTDGLKKRLVYLLEREQLSDSFLVTGLIARLREFYGRMADVDRTSEDIDMHLGMIERLQSDLEKPMEDRSYQATDENIEQFIGKLQNTTSSRPKRRERAKVVLSWLDNLERNVFTPEFWLSSAIKQSERFSVPRIIPRKPRSDRTDE